jgi:hypothetical protein
MGPHDKNGYDAEARFNGFMDASVQNNRKLPSTTPIENKFMITEDMA